MFGELCDLSVLEWLACGLCVARLGSFASPEPMVLPFVERRVVGVCESLVEVSRRVVGSSHWFGGLAFAFCQSRMRRLVGACACAWLLC